MTTEVPRSNPSDHAGAGNSFFDRIVRLSDQINFRIADTDELREAIFRLRYKAYVRDGTILPSASGIILDRYDETSNCYLFGLYIDNVLASSIRLHMLSNENPKSLSREIFSNMCNLNSLQGKSSLMHPTLSPTKSWLGFIGNCHMPRFVRACWRPATLVPILSLQPPEPSISRFTGELSTASLFVNRGPTPCWQSHLA